MNGADDREVNSPRSAKIHPKKSLDAPDFDCAKKEPSKLCGYLSKIEGKGPLRGFKSRWFVYDPRTCYLYYFKTPTDALPLGHIEIADASFYYDVEGEEGQFEIHTAGKEFSLKAPNAQVMRYWLQELQQMRWEFCSGHGLSRRDSLTSPAPPRPHSGLVSRDAEALAVDKSSDTMEKARSDFAVEASAEGQVGAHTARTPTGNFNRSFRQWGTGLRNSMSHLRAGRGADAKRRAYQRSRSIEWEIVEPPEQVVIQDNPRKNSSEALKSGPAFLFDFGRKRPSLKDGGLSGEQGRDTDSNASECNGGKASDMELRLQSQEEELELLRDEMASYKELVRVLQQCLRGSQKERSPAEATPPNVGDTPSAPEDTPTDTAETSREEEPVRLLEGRVKRLEAEKEELLSEVEALRGRRCAFSRLQLPTVSTSPELQELDKLKDSLQGYKSQNKFLNKEILELSALRRSAESRERALEAKYASLEAKLCQVESKYLVLLKEVRNPVCSSSEQSPVLVNWLLEDALQVESSEGENTVLKPHPVSEFDVYGFKTIPEDDDEERLAAKARALDLRSLSLTEQEVSVGVRWENYLAGTVTREMTRSPELKALIRSGVPHDHRTKVWRWCVAFHSRKFRENVQPGYYEDLLAKAREKQNPASKQIELDLMRTLPNNKHYASTSAEGVPKLRNVLLAFSWRNHDIGYCQGLNRLAAIALLYLEEELAFWCLVTIVEVFMPRDYYTKTLLGSQVDQRVLKDLMSEKLPRLHAHFEAHNVDFSLITFNWFLVVFVDSVVGEILFKIWDAFLYEGPKIIFRFALALFKYSEEEFLKLQDSTAIFKHLRCFTHNILDSRKLMGMAYQGMNPFPLRLIRNRRAFHLERVRFELSELDALRQTFLMERETTQQERVLLSDDEEDN
ncbi:hypothetical protein GJAV_G00249100 [Gymnothorax javanicus]|nr:hypothetical protein GJAV_G00249100 [Gymnothorax javanicus]